MNWSVWHCYTSLVGWICFLDEPSPVQHDCPSTISNLYSSPSIVLNRQQWLSTGCPEEEPLFQASFHLQPHGCDWSQKFGVPTETNLQGVPTQITEFRASITRSILVPHLAAKLSKVVLDFIEAHHITLLEWRHLGRLKLKVEIITNLRGWFLSITEYLPD